MIAEAITDSEFNSHLTMWLVGIGSPLSSLLITVIGFLRQKSLSIAGQPIGVELKKEFVTKDELRAHRDELIRDQNKLEQRMGSLELDADKGEIIKAGSERGGMIYRHIDSLRHDMDARLDTVMKAVSRVEGAIEEARTHR